MNNDLKSIGMNFDRWQDAVEAAIGSGTLAVTGEVRGGQLVQFADPSGAQINILAVEPFATFAGFDSTATVTAHISMVNDVLAFAEIIDDSVPGKEKSLTTITCNLAQGPLLVDEPTQQWEQLAITALAVDAQVYDTAEAFLASHPGAEPGSLGTVTSPGASIVADHDGSRLPDASAAITVTVESAHYRTNVLTQQRFIHATISGPFPFDLCLPDLPQLPQPGSVVAGTVVFAAAIRPPAGCGSGGGCDSGGCGCGGH